VPATTEIADFLIRYPPFQHLDPGLLTRVAGGVEVRSYSAGEDVLVEDGLASNHLFVIRSGSMELLHEGEVIDVLQTGESFGHPSLLTGMAPAFTVRAHEDAVCLLLPSDLALEVLGRPTGTTFVATTLRERLTRAGHTVHALPELRGLRVTGLLQRGPVFCDPAEPISDVARRMTEEEVSAVLVRGRDGLGIVTDKDLRAKVVAAGRAPGDPVAAIMTTPVLTIGADRFAFDAMIDMLESGVHHLPVVDRVGNIVGVISSDDLANLESRTPFTVRRAINRSVDEESLVQAAGHLPGLFVALLDAELSAPEIGRVLALQSDSVTARLIDFSVRRHGPPPVAWAWLALGSVARREMTLASDQDNALAYADSDDPAVDPYFERLAREVNAGLARCGFGPDAAEVVARDRRWRMSATAWTAVFRECLETPDRSHLVRAAVSFDFRHALGGLEIVPPLVKILRTASRYPDFLRRLARTATDIRPPLDFRGRLAVRRAGDERGTVDLKLGGIAPIASLARFHALANGITISATLDRLVAAEETGGLDRETAQALREAFSLVCTVRLEHHAARIRAGLLPDNLIVPRQLPPLKRAALRESFLAVSRAQKQLSRFVPYGM
jgi:CBS domain-containing protein